MRLHLHLPRPHRIVTIVWLLLWLGLGVVAVNQAASAIRIPTTVATDVKLPDVDQAALTSIRNRHAPSLITPGSNQTPRDNPFTQ